MKISFAADFCRFKFATSEPEWHAGVERWYQLDPPSYGLCELWWRNQKRELPRAIFLASPGGSNRTDEDFISSGAIHPAKFVHTLPSVRAAAMMQLMKWRGPLLCLQNDPYTVASALSEAAEIYKSENQRVWVLGTFESSGTVVFRLRIGDDGPFVLQQVPSLEGADDSVLLQWLQSPGGKPLSLADWTLSQAEF